MWIREYRWHFLHRGLRVSELGRAFSSGTSLPWRLHKITTRHSMGCLDSSVFRIHPHPRIHFFTPLSLSLSPSLSFPHLPLFTGLFTHFRSTFAPHPPRKKVDPRAPSRCMMGSGGGWVLGSSSPSLPPPGQPPPVESRTGSLKSEHATCGATTRTLRPPFAPGWDHAAISHRWTVCAIGREPAPDAHRDDTPDHRGRSATRHSPPTRAGDAGRSMLSDGIALPPDGRPEKRWRAIFDNMASVDPRSHQRGQCPGYLTGRTAGR